MSEGRARDLMYRFGDLLYRRGCEHGSTGKLNLPLDGPWGCYLDAGQITNRNAAFPS